MAREVGPLRQLLRLPTMRRVALSFFAFNAAEYAVWVAMLVHACTTREEAARRRSPR